MNDFGHGCILRGEPNPVNLLFFGTIAIGALYGCDCAPCPCPAPAGQASPRSPNVVAVCVFADMSEKRVHEIRFREHVVPADRLDPCAPVQAGEDSGR
ncbi:hypothetical protein A4R89_14030 (plasmid) [Acetobacter ascendens]|nr:hypothetical protein A4R89_14030 [Acetobacter ascendens]